MKRFRLLLIALFLLLTCGLLLVAFVTLDTRSARELAQVKQQVHAAGLPLEPGELAQPQPPDDQNAAPLYVQMNHTKTASPVTGANMILDNGVGMRLPDPERREQIRQAVRHQQTLIRMVHQAAGRPVCAFNRNYALGASLLLPEYARMRSATRILRAESALLLADGKPLEAIRNNALGFKIAQHAASDPILIADLVAIAIDAITFQGMEQILYAAGEQPGIAQAVEQSVTHTWQTHSLAYGMRGEFVMTAVEMERMRKAGPSSLQGWVKFDDGFKGQVQKFSMKQTVNWSKFINANESEVLREMLQIAQVADLPYPQSHPTMQAAQTRLEAASQDNNYLLASQFMPVYVQVEVKQAQNRAMAAIVRGAASVLAWKQARGAFPDTLKQAMPMVPVDPFDGQPLRYRREGKGFVIYSVGETGAFNGGTPTQKPNAQEAVFHYPLPAYILNAQTVPLNRKP